MFDFIKSFGCKVFNDKVMQKRLSPEVYGQLQQVISGGESLSKETANAIAEQMKLWALENGATHFTHWFQPMTGITAEKHDSFISPAEGGGMILEFSGKSLVKGEPDASSFPSGGLRATFEARGYTAWDPTSYAFIKDDTLFIPTCFCSYDGSALDKKTPLLKSCEALNTQAMRILKLLDMNDVKKVVASVGSEQEYFLVDRAIAERRPDLMLCGRTILGCKPPKGQEMGDHYFGAIKQRVSAFMKDLDRELWEHGVYAKTKHNEAAPAQHELAPVYTDVNTATDHNQLTMDYMKSVAAKHDLICLLHEKPFNYVNGSGKHNNWSITTDTGINLLNPGKKPEENKRFLLFLTAVIVAVDKYQDLLRASVASAGNDRRLGANEAPPAIVSVFLGEDLTAILTAIETGVPYVKPEALEMELGVHAVPHFKKDTTDRNRTSPFAFTGNKFEFRMVGSSASIASPNIVINTAVAQVLKEFADYLEGKEDINEAIVSLIRENFKAHKRIVFNGNNYSDEWKQTAKERGLLNLPTAVDAIPCYVAPKNVALFTTHNVFNNVELISRCDILLENYYKTINIECLTLINMLKNYVVPACYKLEKTLCEIICGKDALLFDATDEKKNLSFISSSSSMLNSLCDKLTDLGKKAATLGVYEEAKFYRDEILPVMDEAREIADELEAVFPKEDWPFPSYTDLLYSVK